MSSTLFTIDSGSDLPPFEQLRRQVIEAVRSGALEPGSKLPTVRSLAGELGLAANTVARAWRELEVDEVIETRGRLGSFIAPTGDATGKQAQLAAIAYAERIRSLGIDAPAGLEFVKSALGLR